MKNKCIIVAGGDIKNEIVKKSKGDLVICADRGYLNAKKLNLKVDYLIGDFDSFTPTNVGDVKIITLNKIKDDTDTLDAIKLGLEKGYKNFVIYGALGGRIEHSMSNISCLLYLVEHESEGAIIEGNKLIKVLKSTKNLLKSKKGNYFSVFSITETSVVTIKNAFYPLDKFKLTNSYPLGIDNEFINDSPVEIEVSEGTILLIANL